MKPKLTIYLILPAILFSLFLISCSDTGSGPSNSTTSHPNIQMKTGASYFFNNDTISQSGINYRTSWLTNDNYQTYDSNYNGKPCNPVNSVTKDTVFHTTVRSAIDHYSYNQTEGKFYQYGAKKIIDSTQGPSWDLVADFTQSIGTEISLYTLSNLFGQGTLSANVYSKVSADTVLTTLGSLVTFNCYRVTLRADVQLGGSSIGNVYIDYYIGYNTATNTSNPCGRVRTKIYPVSLSGGLKYDGADQMINRFTLP